jgi:SAM-dependent methyltransferase
MPGESKAATWSGYYASYLARARRRGVDPLELLDEEWADGRRTAGLVLPYVTHDADVLELACGIGRVSRFVAPHCRRLYCTDILDEALREARRNLAAFANVTFHRTSGYDLAEFGPNSVDCVYSFTTFFHFDFELVVAYFEEIERVLRPGGVGLIEFKKWLGPRDVDQLLNKIRSQGGLASYERDLDKWRYVSSGMLRVLCDYYRLEVVETDVTRFTFRKARRPGPSPRPPGRPS